MNVQKMRKYQARNSPDSVQRLFDFDADTIEHDIDVWREHWDQIKCESSTQVKTWNSRFSFQIL